MGAITVLDIRVKGKNSKSNEMTFRSWEHAKQVYERNVQTCNNPDEVRRCNGWQLYSIALIDRNGNIKKQFDNFC